jgi:hypothetical protein
VLETHAIFHHILAMSAATATAEVFFTAFKSLKPRQCTAVLERTLADEVISADIADTLALESRRHQPRQSFRQALTTLGNKFDAKEWQWS